ncbi:LysM domain-containing protein [Rhizobium sp. RU20A]|uniref:LysM peptidoglycan-binding domain-containing protein n=1 Tax=Rhizobium sp. RU20A TaxID=1907412 RepID=UPI000954F540|nr:LysM peptidoglycan-binding domain-containing protein [Rhizobium sp. RU20A]SIP92888.1 LysM domain-containing protein [Rhizobium sp. RU20A]
MQKNMAAFLAIGVLAVAILLMVFFIVPSWQKDDTLASAPTADGAAATQTQPVETTPSTTSPAADTAQTTEKAADKTGRPKAAGEAADTVPAGSAGEGATNPDAAASAAAPETQATDAQPSAASPAQPSDQTAASTGMPSFDVLRVEPDGSAVIAGRAAPNTTIRILSGDKVLATAEAGPSGDFAAILTEPLAPGDYQLVISATDKAGKEQRSEEIATVSVPATDKSQLLAMVSKPGEASRLITTPEAEAAKAVPVTPPAAAASDVAPAAGTTVATGAADAATPAEATEPAGQTPPAAATTGNGPAVLQVAAVEIEGDRLFVAGKARPDATVRVYADDQLLGSAKADAAGNFVVDGLMPLSVGSHTIRADMLTPDGAKVELRAAVPFDRPEGDQVAAVASASQTPGAAMAPLAGGSFDGLRAEVTKAFGLLKGLFANGRLPDMEALAAARSATEIALGSLADFKAADTTSAEGQALIARSAKAAGDALAKLRALPSDAAAVAAGLPSIEQAIAAVLAPNSGQPTGEPQAVSDARPQPSVASEGANAPAGTAAADAAASTAPATSVPDGSAESAPATASGEPATIQQAPLQQSNSSVIIRRGDTLWQISRRVYGAGVRYTTIYLANKEQIQDPDRILPGQIFGVPDKSLPDAEAEEIHRKRVTD